MDRDEVVRLNGRSVLVVEHDSRDRARVAAWLEQAGYHTLLCPGPNWPDYTCLGGRGEPCPLAAAVDVVVLDLRLASDDLMTGTPGWEILNYYLRQDKRVIALAGRGDSARIEDDAVTVLRKPVDRATLVDAVRHQSALSGRRGSF